MCIIFIIVDCVADLYLCCQPPCFYISSILTTLNLEKRCKIKYIFLKLLSRLQVLCEILNVANMLICLIRWSLLDLPEKKNCSQPGRLESTLSFDVLLLI